MFQLNLSCLKIVENLDDKFNLESVFVFDNLGNIVCVFPCGKFKEDFYREIISLSIRFLDTNILRLSSIESQKYYALYQRHFRSIDNKLDSFVNEYERKSQGNK